LWGTLAGAAVIAAGAGLVWLQGQREIASHLEQADEWNAIRQTEAVLKAGPRPADWPVRGFVPASVLQSAVENLKDAEVEIPIGKADGGHVDGFVHFVIRSAKFTPEDVQFGVVLETDVSYRPDRDTPWWSGATAAVEVRGAFLPSAEKTRGDGVTVTQFRIVPESLALAAGVENLNVWVIAGLARALAAEEAGIRFHDALVFEVPGLVPFADLDPSVDSTSFQPFGGVETKDSGTHITVRMKGTPKRLQTVLDHWLVTKSGVWEFGGKPVAAPDKEEMPAPEAVEARRTGLTAKLQPFQRDDALVEVTVPIKTVTDFVDALVAGTPRKLDVSTSGTTGNITDAIVVHNDKVLGNVGLEVRPRGDNFGHGSIDVATQPAQWDPKVGFVVPLSLHAHADVALDVHVRTGIGGGVGSSVDLSADGDVPHAVFQAVVESRAVPQGSAIVLQPKLPCVPMVLNVHPGLAALAPVPWIQVDPVGLQFEREIGGMKIAPAVLVDSLPLFSKLPSRADPTPAKLTNAAVYFPKPYLVMTFAPDSVGPGQADITLKAKAELRLRGEAETEAEKNARHQLRDAMKDAAPGADCKTLTGLKIVGAGTTILDIYQELGYIGESLKRHIEVAKDILKAATDLDPRNTPENLIKLADGLGKAGSEDAKHVWDLVTHPPEPEVKIGGTPVKATPVGPQVGPKGSGFTITPVGPVPSSWLPF